MLAKDHGRAIQLYTKVLREPENPYRQEAQELLGLARERNGQVAHAVAEYRHYLELYPDDEGAQRVSQRLAGLTTTKKITASRRQASSDRDEPGRWDVFGGISQYYRRDVNQFDEPGRGRQSIIGADRSGLVARRRGDRYDFSSRLTMGNLYDLLGEDKGPGNSSRVYYLYADVVDRRTMYPPDSADRLCITAVCSVVSTVPSSPISGGPLTRFNFVTGFPVDSTQDGVDTDRNLYGFSVDFSQILDLLDLSVFYNTQNVDGIEDRQAIGGEVRYFDEKRSLITALDYDVSYSVLNSFVMFGNWAFDNRITVNGLVDIRRSPFLTTRNALIGQQAASIDELLLTFSESEIRRLALERSGEIQTYTLGASRPLFDRFQIQGDITMTSFDGTPASGGVPEMPDLDNEFYYNLNLVGSSLIREGDSSIIGITVYRRKYGGYDDTDSGYPLSNKSTVSVSIRAFDSLTVTLTGTTLHNGSVLPRFDSCIDLPDDTGWNSSSEVNGRAVIRIPNLSTAHPILSMAVIVRTSDGVGAMNSTITRGPISFAIRSSRWSFLFMFLISYGCTGFQRDAQVRQYLDENTGATVTHLAEPLVFSTGKMRAAYTRDYVTVGPLEVNRQGHRSYLLWMNFWSTVDRIDNRRDRAGQFDVVYLMLDGEPMQLNASGDSIHVMSVAEAPYSRQGDDSLTSVYPVTKAQMTRLAQARDVELRTSADAIEFGKYQLWRAPEQSIELFANYVSRESAVGRTLQATAHE